MDAASSASSVASGGLDGVSASEFLNLGMFSQQAATQQQLGEGNNATSFGSSSLGLVSNGFNDAGSFDLSDFPSLAGTGGGGVPGASNGLSAAMRQQQLLAAAAQQHGNNTKNANNLYRLAMNSTAAGAGGPNGNNFSMTTEDFPALGGTSLQQLAPMGSSLLASQRAPSSGNHHGGSSMYSSSDFVEHQVGGDAALSAGTGLLGGAGLGGLGSALQQQQQSSAGGGVRSQQTQQQQVLSAAVGSGSATSQSAPASGGGNALAGDYGLLGLLAVIRMTDADRNALALGSDLTLLGLNLGSAEQIYSTFSSPWSDAPVSKEPHYQLPMCYYMHPPALKTGHLSKFQLETLFYIFYALPKDVLQAYSAQELYTREWRFHAELKLWFKRATAADGAPSNNATNVSSQFLYFDIGAWERRLFNGTMSQNVTQGFLTEEEVRVKFASS
ncbi:hypothetical protein MPSEU_001092800 [Mayamaea pseudoterrestris]|nr:hypothetical protein MPSEU_001092800 [Mayamaea pseudoterrestris]